MGNLDHWLLTLNCPLDALMDSIFGDHFCHFLRVHALGQHLSDIYIWISEPKD